ncbi:hypothetical protein SS50377_22893 [Spironucleus salmonicida]|uniref:Uncharacterized protein n=1 Tax=Spironucleus salmonicida TaxID=348837 RepID=V6LWY5_9EUKA|nr:hypothetical protein SS50377_22893 [Spironucleus salmonicida]|eukprot:EST48743.1 hypothetical protein SS50377_11063 [Spironucleus salmonicida]
MTDLVSLNYLIYEHFQRDISHIFPPSIEHFQLLDISAFNVKLRNYLGISPICTDVSFEAFKTSVLQFAHISPAAHHNFTSLFAACEGLNLTSFLALNVEIFQFFNADLQILACAARAAEVANYRFQAWAHFRHFALGTAVFETNGLFHAAPAGSGAFAGGVFHLIFCEPQPARRGPFGAPQKTDVREMFETDVPAAIVSAFQGGPEAVVLARRETARCAELLLAQQGSFFTLKTSLGLSAFLAASAISSVFLVAQKGQLFAMLPFVFGGNVLNSQVANVESTNLFSAPNLSGKVVKLAENLQRQAFSAVKLSSNFEPDQNVLIEENCQSGQFLLSILDQNLWFTAIRASTKSVNLTVSAVFVNGNVLIDPLDGVFHVLSFDLFLQKYEKCAHVSLLHGDVFEICLTEELDVTENFKLVMDLDIIKIVSTDITTSDPTSIIPELRFFPQAEQPFSPNLDFGFSQQLPFSAPQKTELLSPASSQWRHLLALPRPEAIHRSSPRQACGFVRLHFPSFGVLLVSFQTGEIAETAIATNQFGPLRTRQNAQFTVTANGAFNVASDLVFSAFSEDPQAGQQAVSAVVYWQEIDPKKDQASSFGFVRLATGFERHFFFKSRENILGHLVRLTQVRNRLHPSSCELVEVLRGPPVSDWLSGEIVQCFSNVNEQLLNRSFRPQNTQIPASYGTTCGFIAPDRQLDTVVDLCFFRLPNCENLLQQGARVFFTLKAQALHKVIDMQETVPTQSPKLSIWAVENVSLQSLTFSGVFSTLEARKCSGIRPEKAFHETFKQQKSELVFMPRALLAAGLLRAGDHVVFNVFCAHSAVEACRITRIRQHVCLPGRLRSSKIGPIFVPEGAVFEPRDVFSGMLIPLEQCFLVRQQLNFTENERVLCVYISLGVGFGAELEGEEMRWCRFCEEVERDCFGGEEESSRMEGEGVENGRGQCGGLFSLN